MTDTVADVEAISSQPTAGAGPRRRESDAVAMAIISQPTYESGAPQDDLESCGVKAARIEARVCATSTGWGLLAGRPSWMLVLFWLFRHAIYFAIAAALIVLVQGSAVVIALSVFFLYVHTHKAILFFRLQSEKAAEASEKAGAPEKAGASEEA
mmetsp:Transcript_20235/g.61113  ORF Transcript_20235/g.61113 Transcript_20235/m.61113 type:complete len:154 (-) Transcript_20235:53-514(-)